MSSDPVQTTKMTAAEAVDFLNTWGEAELNKATSQTTAPEVTDATIVAALNAFYQLDKTWEGDSLIKRDMSSAIRAALAVMKQKHG